MEVCAIGTTTKKALSSPESIPRFSRAESIKAPDKATPLVKPFVRVTKEEKKQQYLQELEQNRSKNYYRINALILQLRELRPDIIEFAYDGKSQWYIACKYTPIVKQISETLWINGMLSTPRNFIRIMGSSFYTSRCGDSGLCIFFVNHELLIEALENEGFEGLRLLFAEFKEMNQQFPEKSCIGKIPVNKIIDNFWYITKGEDQ